jgi:phenylacetate-CoA ligase
MHAGLVDRVIFPLHERLKGKRTYARLRELERTQWLAPEELRALQLERLRAHLTYARREVPYYARVMDEGGVRPEQLGAVEDLRRLPFLTKEIVRTRFRELQPRRPVPGTTAMSTGGSTGAPVTVLVDRERGAFGDAARLRAHRWFGVGMGAREIVLWGSSIELGRQDLVRTTRDRLLNSRLLSAFDLGEAALARYAEVVRRTRPLKLFGYASALHLLARFLERQGWQAPAAWPRAVFTTAEPLYDFQRAVIASVFACPVAVEYGCRDAGLVATECPAGGLHVAAEGMLVEILAPEDGDGLGEIVVTNLDSYAMPIIRYRTGDLGAWADGPCPCGRTLPRLQRVEGRRTDFLLTPRGKLMHALAVIYVLREVPSIREFQVVQEQIDRVVVKVAGGEGFSTATAAAIRTRLGALFDGETEVRVECVDAIARPLSGKHRYVVSQVADAHLEALLGAAGSRSSP